MDHRSPANVTTRAAWLAGYDANVRGAADWIHASWHGTLAPLVTITRERAPELSSACSLLLLRRLRVPSPTLGDFDAIANRLLALPVADMLRLLRIRALLCRRAELRHWIDRASRERLASWTGADGSRALSVLAALRDMPRARDLSRCAPVTPLAELSGDDVAWEGWCLFEREQIWSRTGPMCLSRLALARDTAYPAWIECTEVDGSGAMLLARLPSLFPEWSWLFG